MPLKRSRPRPWLSALLLLLPAATAGFAQRGWTSSRIGPAGKDLNTVYFDDSKRGWIGGDDGFLSATTDEGHSWAQQSVQTPQAINDVYFTGKDTGFVLAGSEIFGTSDSGRTWKSLQRFPASDFNNAEPELYSIRFAGKRKGWVVGSASRDGLVVDSIVLYTNDAGASWQRRRVPTSEELIHLDFVDDTHGWAVGDKGTILHTENGGESWTKQSSGVKTTLFHVDFRNDKVGWAVGDRGTILRTSNGGDSWFLTESNVRSKLLSVQFIGQDQGWIVGRGGVILRSEDGGRTWIRQATPTTHHLYALFVGKKMGWAVGGDGTVLRYER